MSDDRIRVEAQAIDIGIDGRALGSMATRPFNLCQQTVEFDTRTHRDEKALLELSLTGAALHCFDFRIVP